LLELSLLYALFGEGVIHITNRIKGEKHLK
jgi:hypothetical protein